MRGNGEEKRILGDFNAKSYVWIAYGGDYLDDGYHYLIWQMRINAINQHLLDEDSKNSQILSSQKLSGKNNV